MRPTPSIPDWLRDFRHPAYTNIYQLYPQETRIFGTESLYGDWDAETLLLAKDFAPACLIHQRLADGCPRPYHHSDWTGKPAPAGARTNRTLFACTEALPGRKLYGSAFGGLLRDDRKLSGSLPDFNSLSRTYAARLIRWTAASMPNLRAIACLGKDAWICCSIAAGCGDGSDWGAWRDRAEPQRVAIEGRSIALLAMRHPSRGRSPAVFTSLARELADVPPAVCSPAPCAHCARRGALTRAA